MTSAQSSSPVRLEDDDILLRRFLGGDTQLLYSGYLRNAAGRGAGSMYVYHISSGWTVATRPYGWEGCSLLSLDHPGLMVSGPERWRRKVLEASKQVEGASILPVSFASYWQAAGVDRDKPPHVIEINDQDKKKSTGVLFPLAQLAIDKEGQLQIQLNQNPWKLVDVLDWKGTPGVN